MYGRPLFRVQAQQLSVFGGKGFTLVELLVTMILASIIAAFAIPGFSKTTQTADVRNMKSDFIIFEKLFKNYYINNGDSADLIKGMCPNTSSYSALSDANMIALNEALGTNFNQSRYVIECQEPSTRDVYMRFRFTGSEVSGTGVVRVVTDINNNVTTWSPSCSANMKCSF